MKRIFESRSFREFRNVRFDESVRGTIVSSQKTTVFLSHKHSDLEDMKDVIGFLQTTYGVLVYIDSNDSSMPMTTSGLTAEKLKNRIKKCDKFILLATDGAVDSKWCNWELGFGDAHKYKDNIALFPIKPQGSADTWYKGKEYMSIYPYIAEYDGTERYLDGTIIARGYYVCTEMEGERTIIPLLKWLKK